jgi:hypothetical protein
MRGCSALQEGNSRYTKPKIRPSDLLTPRASSALYALINVPFKQNSTGGRSRDYEHDIVDFDHSGISWVSNLNGNTPVWPSGFWSEIYIGKLQHALFILHLFNQSRSQQTETYVVLTSIFSTLLYITRDQTQRTSQSKPCKQKATNKLNVKHDAMLALHQAMTRHTRCYKYQASGEGIKVATRPRSSSPSPGTATSPLPPS